MTTILYGVDLQHDFMDQDGRLYVPGAEAIKPAVKELNGYAKQQRWQRLFSMDRHSASDPELEENGGPFPQHCMDWSYSQRANNGEHGLDLIPEAGLERPAQQHPYRVPSAAPSMAGDPTYRYLDGLLYGIGYAKEEAIIEKQSYDVFQNANAKDVLQVTFADNAVVHGVATDYCVRAAVLGMQELGIQSYIVTDAIKGIDAEGTRKAVQEMEGAGVRFVTLKELYSLDLP